MRYSGRFARRRTCRNRYSVTYREILERIHRRKSLLIDYDFSVWKDDNVNNATEVDQVEIPLFGGLRFTVNEKPVEAWVARTGVNLAPPHALAGRWKPALEFSGRACAQHGP